MDIPYWAFIIVIVFVVILFYCLLWCFTVQVLNWYEHSQQIKRDARLEAFSQTSVKTAVEPSSSVLPEICEDSDDELIYDPIWNNVDRAMVLEFEEAIWNKDVEHDLLDMCNSLKMKPIVEPNSHYFHPRSETIPQKPQPFQLYRRRRRAKSVLTTKAEIEAQEDVTQADTESIQSNIGTATLLTQVRTGRAHSQQELERYPLGNPSLYDEEMETIPLERVDSCISIQSYAHI